MPDDSPRTLATPRASASRVFAGFVAAGACLAAADALGIALTLPRPAAGLTLRAAHYLFDAAETLGIAAAAGLLCCAFVRLPRWASFLGATVVTGALVDRAIGENLLRLASLTLEGRFETALFVAYLVGVSLAFPLAYRLTSYAAQRRGLRFVPFALAVVGMAAGYRLQPDEYQGIHCVVAWGAAMVAGVAIAPIVEAWGRALFARRAGRVALAACVAFALFGIAVPPSNAIRYELFRLPCPVAPWVLATTFWRLPRVPASVGYPDSPWFHERTVETPSEPLSPRLLPANGVVLLLTIDAVRADIVNDPANDTLFPTFARLKRDGVTFPQAFAPASQTSLSLGTLFSGRTFSEELWTDHGRGSARFSYPADDTSTRFPELLAAHGVTTVNVSSTPFLANDFGVVRGFSEQRLTVTGAHYTPGQDIIDLVIGRLRNPPPGPLFLHAHIMDPHAPYDRGRKDGTDYERYLSEVAVADTQIGRVLDLLESKYGKRWLLIVTADHGEAFGEHGTHGHAKTLYQELLHVPLMIRGPMLVPHVVDQPVALADLGPTILDLYTLPTPPTFLGESLAPLLAGQAKTLTRPLFAEGRLRRSLTLPDGVKVIEDPRRKLVEVYDLSADPGETRNLFDEDRTRSDAALAALRAFYALHTRGGDYVPPYKP